MVRKGLSLLLALLWVKVTLLTAQKARPARAGRAKVSPACAVEDRFFEP
jgi:hypothetical protein